MGIIKELLTKVDKLGEENLLLKEKLRLVEARLNNIASKVQTPQVSHFTPSLTKTLDADNIWMGEKGEDSYTNMAKLDVFYDEDEDKWKCRGEAGVVDTVDFTYQGGVWKSSGVIPQIIVSTYPGVALLKTADITDDGEDKTVFYSFPIYAEYYPG
ncbi:hypothetical protein LCGC14_1166420 [marine sediment metagenome]|uniref:Uncharacterized protein n=1 Tax=marine sediment metagenome TaxID=412755 RepID=A0A0F9P9A1_9ZZZZ